MGLVVVGACFSSSGPTAWASVMGCVGGVGAVGDPACSIEAVTFIDMSVAVPHMKGSVPLSDAVCIIRWYRGTSGRNSPRGPKFH